MTTPEQSPRPPRRIITIRVEYDDNPDRPRQIDVRAWVDRLEIEWSHHLATPVDAWIIADALA
jgi:hypothetical protein